MPQSEVQPQLDIGIILGGSVSVFVLAAMMVGMSRSLPSDIWGRPYRGADRPKVRPTGGTPPTVGVSRMSLEEVERRIKSYRLRVTILQGQATDARESYLGLMRQYGLTVIPTEVEMAQRYPYLSLRIRNAKSLENRLVIAEGYLTALQKRRNELLGRGE